MYTNSPLCKIVYNTLKTRCFIRSTFFRIFIVPLFGMWRAHAAPNEQEPIKYSFLCNFAYNMNDGD